MAEKIDGRSIMNKRLLLPMAKKLHTKNTIFID